VLALAAPTAALLLTLRRCGHGVQHEYSLAQTVCGLPLQAAVGEAVVGALQEALQQVPLEASTEIFAGLPAAASMPSLAHAADLAVNGAVNGELRTSAGLGASTSGTAALRAMRLAVHADVLAALERIPSPASPLQLSLQQVISRAWYRYISGLHRFAFSSLFEEWGERGADVRELAYVRASAAACCWYPHREFVMASEWPSKLHPELLGARPNGAAGQAILWSDLWGVYVQGGRRVPQWVIVHPEALTVQSIQGERDKELRRILIERYGWQRYLRDSGAEVVERRAPEPVPAALPQQSQEPAPQAAAG